MKPATVLCVCLFVVLCKGVSVRRDVTPLGSIRELSGSLRSRAASKLHSHNSTDTLDHSTEASTLLLRHPRLHRFKRSLKAAAAVYRATSLRSPAFLAHSSSLSSSAARAKTQSIRVNSPDIKFKYNNNYNNNNYNNNNYNNNNYNNNYKYYNSDVMGAVALLDVGLDAAEETKRSEIQRDIASRVSEGMCQRQLVTQLREGVWRDIRDSLQESILNQVTTESVVKNIIIPIGECIAYGIVHELADTVAQRFLAQFEGAIQSVIPDGIQLLFGPLLALYLLKGLGRTMAVSISDPLQVFLNRDLVEIVTVQFMGYLSSQGDPQLSHAVTHVVSDAIVKGVVQAVTHSLTHGITHAVTHTTTHEVIHQYYCIYCHYYNEYCTQCYHYSDNPELHRLFQVNVAD